MKASDYVLIEKLVNTIERLNLDHYVEHITNRRRMIFNHLLYGMLRGVGFSFGFTVLGAALIVLLQNVISDHIPRISGFIAEVIRAIEERM